MLTKPFMNFCASLRALRRTVKPKAFIDSR